MNSHRDLIISAQKKPKNHFLTLPNDLQDEIMSGFDTGSLTLKMAYKLVARHGFRLSIMAISKYYRRVRQERRDLMLRNSHNPDIHKDGC